MTSPSAPVSEAATAAPTAPTAAPTADLAVQSTPARRRPDGSALGAAGRRVGVRLLGVGIIVGIWWAVAAAKIWDPLLLPSPGAVWRAFVKLTGEHDGVVGYSGHTLQYHWWISMRRILIGSGLGSLLGLVLGLLIGTVPVLKLLLEPAVTFLRQLPPLAYFSLLIIWFGIDEAPKIWLLVIAAMPPVAVATAAAVAGVHRDYVNGARSLGAGRWAVIRHVIVPAALPEILVGVRLGTGVAYTSVVAAETVNGLPGIGGMIRDAQRYLQTDVVILGIVVIGLSGVLVDALLAWAERRAGPWRGRA